MKKMIKTKQPGRKRKAGENGFEQWGGYMNAKITKLEEQFQEDSTKVQTDERLSNIFEGIAIFVNGYTEPSSDDLRLLMLLHGGTFHHYYRSERTTHVIASNLPNSKMSQLKTMKVVKPEWMTESVAAGKLLDYKKFLLFANQQPLQSEFNFKSNSKTEGTKLTDVSAAQHSKGIAKTAVDEQFLTEFYNNSRLHHLSTMGAMFKQYVGELKEKHDGVFPGRTRLLECKENGSTPDTDEDIPGRIIMHIDMDCFFVSVALRNHPELKGQPIAVTHAKGNPTHQRPGVNRKFEYEFYKKRMEVKIGGKARESSDSSEEEEKEKEVQETKKKPWTEQVNSMSEVASCSYEARAAGVYNGMYLGSALKLCPNLKTVPYDFEGYKSVSFALYNTIAEYTLDIEAVSCDELFVDCESLLRDVKVKPLDFVALVRKEIRERTKCPSSAGLGCNKLQARLATKRAKPDGQFFLTPLMLPDFMMSIDVGDLPGVGRTLHYKMKAMNVRTCQDLQNISLDVLKKEFGGKTGETLYKSCRGLDDRIVHSSHQRKSVSAEVNYGIRFENNEEALTFFNRLSGEVSNRLKEIKMKGKCISLKLMVRAKDAPLETAKFLGHGACDHLTRSVSLPAATDDPSVIAKYVVSIYQQLSIPPSELRGIGIQLTKLESLKKNPSTLQAFLKSRTELPKQIPKTSKATTEKLKLPSSSQIDHEVLDSLPEDIRLEILSEYGMLDQQKNKLDNNLPSTSKQQAPVEEFQSAATGLNAYSELSVREVRTLIKEWVAAEAEPQSCDIDMLVNYVKGVIGSKKVEEVDVLLKCLRRHVVNFRQSDGAWKEAYRKIIDSVQQYMISSFQRTLVIEEL